MNEAQNLILGVLRKAYNDASTRVEMLGMLNTYGLSAAERDEQRATYQRAVDDALMAKQAYDAYRASV